MCDKWVSNVLKRILIHFILKQSLPRSKDENYIFIEPIAYFMDWFTKKFNLHQLSYR